MEHTLKTVLSLLVVRVVACRANSSTTIRSLNSRLSNTFTVVAVNALGQSPESSPSETLTPLN